MKKAAAMSEYRDWGDVDRALRRMGEIHIELSRLEGEMTLKVNEVRQEYDVKGENLKGEKKRLTGMIEAFAQEHKDEFAKVRSKELTFGTISFRVVHKVMVRSKKATVAALESMGLTACLRITKEPDRESMKGLDPLILAKAGVALRTEDQLSIEPNVEHIADKEAA